MTGEPHPGGVPTPAHWKNLHVVDGLSGCFLRINILNSGDEGGGANAFYTIRQSKDSFFDSSFKSHNGIYFQMGLIRVKSPFSEHVKGRSGI